MPSPAYHARQALSCLRQSPYAALVAAATVAIALALSGACWLAERSIETALAHAGAEARITVFLAPGADGLGIAHAARQIAGPGGGAELVSPAEELARLKTDLRAAGQSLDALAGNPLPASVEIRLPPSRIERGALVEIHAASSRLRALPGVSEVDDGASFISRLETILRAVRAIGAVLLVIVVAVALFLVGNVVRLTVFARRDEIDILRLVGATDGFIATPFAIEGALQGLLGGGIAALLVHLLETIGLPRATASLGFAREILPPHLPWTALAGIVVLGVAMGLGASLVAVVRFLRSAA